MADGKWLLGMALMLICSAAQAEPPFIALTTTDSVQVKLTSHAPGSDIAYRISRWPDGEALTTGKVKAADIMPDASGLHVFNIAGLQPKLWSPQDPQLYEIELTGIGKARIGFRTFEVRDREFYLNGRPLYLRAWHINPPGRDLPEATGKDPEFIRDYLKLVKSANANIVRTDDDAWLDACDEIGLLNFQGNYGPIPGTTTDGELPDYERTRARYRRIVLDLASHPSVVIYHLSNEVQYKKIPDALDFLTRIREDVRLVDPTRPVIGNTGFGLGQPGEIYDIHPYYGYYSGNLCDWYRLADHLKRAGEANQPLTLTECVGAYTSDAGTFLTMSKQMSTMVRWAGPQADQRTPALEYQAELVRQVVEISRRMRTDESGIASVMPFTYFIGWANAMSADDLIIKPAFTTLREVYQPVLISAECWRRNLYSGDNLKLRLCVANDDDEGRDLPPSVARVQVVSQDGETIASGQVGVPAVPYYANRWAWLSIPIPEHTARGDYSVRMTLIENGKTVSTNGFPINVAPRDWTNASGLSVFIYDPSGLTEKALKQIGVSVHRMSSLTTLPKDGVLVIGELALGEKDYPSKKSVEAFLARGGRILCLRQNLETWRSDWLPVSLVPDSESLRRQITYIHPIGGNAALFEGLRSRDLRTWNEIGRTSENVPEIGPVIGTLKPASPADLRSTRIWAVCGQMMRGAAVTEVFGGKGSVILSQFRCAARIAHDPFAAKFLGNLVRYASSPDHSPLVDLSQPVRWDFEAVRAGVWQSPVQGFLPHSRVYQHKSVSKGLLGEDHRVDGMTLVGRYSHNGNGWIDPVPDQNVEGWGIIYGRLSRPAVRFVLTVQNTSDAPSTIRLLLDDRMAGSPISVPPGERKTLTWPAVRKPGPVKVKLQGDQRLVLLDSRFE